MLFLNALRVKIKTKMLLCQGRKRKKPRRIREKGLDALLSFGREYFMKVQSTSFMEAGFQTCVPPLAVGNGTVRYTSLGPCSALSCRSLQWK